MDHNSLFPVRILRSTALLIVAIAFCAGVSGQQNVEDSVIFTPMVNVTFGVQMPGADMADRFGINGTLGGSFLVKDRHNFIYGVGYNFIFSSDVKEDSILKPLMTAQGEVLDQNGEYAFIQLRERGYHLNAQFGKLFPLIGPNPNSGFVVLAGVGFMEHRIRIDVESNKAPGLRGDYRKGYDRLTNGLTTSQYVGYRYMGNNRLLNFYFGVEAIQGFTQGRRSYQFDLMRADDEPRLDLLYGVRVGWSFPIYRRSAQDYYYY